MATFARDDARRPDVASVTLRVEVEPALTIMVPATTVPDRSPAGQSAAPRSASWSDAAGIRLVLTWTMLLIGVISWRSDAYYEGGLDPVVVAKAGLTLVALGVAAVAAAGSTTRRPVGARTVVLVGAYLSVTLVGALSGAAPMPSAVLAVRVLVLAAAVICIVIANPMDAVVRTLCAGMSVVGLICAVTGVGSVLSGGRLTGGLFPVNPNQIALLFGPPIIYAVWRLLRGIGSVFDLCCAVAFSGLTLLTGSRTGLLALLVAIVALVLQARPLPVGAFIACVAAIPLIAYLVVSTGAVSSYFVRGDSANVTTLSSRTIAWNAAFSGPTDFWQHWFGGGLAVKTVNVTGTYWSTQVLDSSWVSAFVQGGILGIVLLGAWALWSLGAAFRCTPPWRWFWSAAALYAIVRSLLSSGLIDAHVLFVVMLVASLATEPVTRRAPHD